MAGHIEFDKGLVDLLERQQIHHLVCRIGGLVQIVVPEGLQCLAVCRSGSVDIICE